MCKTSVIQWCSLQLQWITHWPSDTFARVIHSPSLHIEICSFGLRHAYQYHQIICTYIQSTWFLRNKCPYTNTYGLGSDVVNQIYGGTFAMGKVQMLVQSDVQYNYKYWAGYNLVRSPCGLVISQVICQTRMWIPSTGPCQNVLTSTASRKATSLTWKPVLSSNKLLAHYSSVTWATYLVGTCAEAGQRSGFPNMATSLRPWLSVVCRKHAIYDHACKFCISKTYQMYLQKANSS